MTSRSRKKPSRKSSSRPPQNRRKTGGKLLFGKGIDPAIGKPTQFKPGQSGNAGGRPTKTPLTDELLELLKVADPRGVTLARRIATIICKKAEKGDSRFVNLIFDRIEGPAVQLHKIGGDDDAPPVKLSVTDAHERLAQVIERIKARQAQTATQDNTTGGSKR